MENVRRRNKLKRSRQRRNRKIVTVVSVMGIILAAVMTFFYMFRVTEVKVAGNTRHSDEMIIQYVQEDLLTTNTMLASWFRKSIEVADIPFVESLDIEALDNNTIRIYVNEKQIVGYVVENGHKMFFDKDGYVLEIMPLTQAEQQGIQAELEKFEQLRAEEEGMPPETGTPDGETNSSEEENPNGALNAVENENGFAVEAPKVPWILGLDRKNLSEETRIVVENFSVFNTIQGIWRISSKYEIVPERVLFDEEYNITLVYQNGTILCELGPDTILEEKMTRIAAILPNLTDKIGILHLEDYDIGTDGIIFSQESEYTVMSKINGFLQKK